MFSNQWQCIEKVKQCHQDLLGLLGFDLQHQEPVVEKILGFMSKIVHKAISKHVRSGNDIRIESYVVCFHRWP
jgi:hypothetical protein